ncbi:hypothetical protein [Rhizobium azibense]|uniref:hypothetical protein n=1 Tax=Rhizobium azibense TaxID=1136135 RepID=UPI00140549AF|nr:hypothetical protein [Rhizobium azibense]
MSDDRLKKLGIFVEQFGKVVDATSPYHRLSRFPPGSANRPIGRLRFASVLCLERDKAHHDGRPSLFSCLVILVAVT